MLDFTFLTKEQLGELDILKIRGLLANLTDFACLLGVDFRVPGPYDINISGIKNAGRYWTCSMLSDGSAYAVSNVVGGATLQSITNANIGVRPVIKYDEIKDICLNKRVITDKILEVEYGYYPQNAVSKELQAELNEQLKQGKLSKTDKQYIFNSAEYDDEIIEFEYKGKKYVKFSCSKSIGELSNGILALTGNIVWLEVSPIKWLVDENENIAISENVLFGGIKFNNNRDYKGDFKNTTIKKYMDNSFSKDILGLSAVIKTKDISLNKINDLKNVYEFDFNEVTEEDLIRASLESNLAPFLHGKSSDGKSARVKQFDPDAEIVYLRNATPDSLNGKSVYNASSGEMIDVPPTWYVKLKEKCEKEPDKLHIVFFDELTNALPSIQGMAFNIILDKEVNGIWKLPENARVVAAGNDIEDSLAANKMAEPLFNRFNHVYINTTVDDWLKWAITPNNSYERLAYKKEEENPKIHPAIYAYIAYKREAALRTKFTGEKPNADPRKWEMASKLLYKTNNPNMLRGLIGEELTTDFVAFTKAKVITIEDVINGNYDEKIFEIDVSEKYLTVLALSYVEEENVKVVRAFIRKLGSEFTALFDSLWTRDNDKRLEMIMDIKEKEFSEIVEEVSKTKVKVSETKVSSSPGIRTVFL